MYRVRLPGAMSTAAHSHDGQTLVEAPASASRSMIRLAPGRMRVEPRSSWLARGAAVPSSPQPNGSATIASSLAFVKRGQTPAFRNIRQCFLHFSQMQVDALLQACQWIEDDDKKLIMAVLIDAAGPDLRRKRPLSDARIARRINDIIDTARRAVGGLQ